MPMSCSELTWKVPLLPYQCCASSRPASPSRIFILQEHSGDSVLSRPDSGLQPIPTCLCCFSHLGCPLLTGETLDASFFSCYPFPPLPPILAVRPATFFPRSDGRSQYLGFVSKPSPGKKEDIYTTT